ncbi:exodeoxyribonuclease VII small subunit [Georgenia yuyongxinii]|uniref:Exodeoxyribonuclease 7 small subunit n=1 Tax=Georgenia yuyongxinii TaxID=2589797 RepID=A0A5B8C7R6_9MICO|nr:exodeoxyribonuclease VII small subunit [Georgenia yuyongxinii]QDC26508.1 exodeoxyribonuclease VII small subunit [Georgenia yuyongxinii]
MDAAERPDVSTLSYEQARDELIEVVHHLEAGSTSLEDALALWERGEALAARCQAWLDGARERLEAARAGDGQPVGAPGGAGAAGDNAREVALEGDAAGLGEEDA